jgi:hypothetical protein
MTLAAWPVVFNQHPVVASSKQKSWMQHAETCQARLLTIYSPHDHNRTNAGKWPTDG